MSAASKLAVGGTFTLVVKDIKQAAETFNGNAGRVYCHFFWLEDDRQERYQCQVCNEFPEQHICNINDLVEVRVKSFNKNTHTIEVLKVNSSNSKQPAIKEPSNQKQDVFPATSNLMVHGKASAVSVQLAISMWANRPLTKNGLPASDINKVLPPQDIIIPLAEEIYQYLLKKG